MMESFYIQIKNTISKSKKNKIALIGKGLSIEKYLSFDFSDFFVININDTYKFIKGELIIINKPWAFNDIFKSKINSLIISDNKIKIPINNKKIKRVNFIEIEKFKNISDIKKFLNDKNIFFEPILLSSIKIAKLMSELRKQNIELYLLGFDFNFKSLNNYTSKLLEDHEDINFSSKKKILNKQKILLNNIISYKHLPLKIKHIGNYNFSYKTNKNFINNYQSLNSDSKDTKRYKVKIVAELTTNHFGDFAALIEMVKLSKKAGADYIKIQKRDVENFFSSKELSKYYYSEYGNTFGDYRRGLELSLDEIDKLDKFCKKINIKWFSSVLDEKSFDEIIKFNPDLIKIPSTVSNFKNLHNYVAKRYNGEIVISTGYTKKSYEKYILNKFSKNKKIYLLQCTSSYPCKFEDCNLAVITQYRNLSNKNEKIIPGYSSHDIGNLASMMAISAGAMMIEKHVKYKSINWGHFDNVALNLKNNEFTNFVKDMRKAELVFGNKEKRILSTEHHKYKEK